MKIKILFLLLLSVVATYGETTDEIQLGARDVPFSVSYGIWDIPEGSQKYVCLSLKEPADLQITVSRTLTDGQKPLMMLYHSYQMHLLCTNYDSNVSTEAGKTVTIRNVPAGDYKLYVDAKNFSTLQIQGTVPDLDNTAVDLGSFDDSFQQTELGCTGSIFDVYHGNGIADGKIAYRFHIDRPMDFRASHSGASTVSSSCLYLMDDRRNVLHESCGDIDNVGISHANLPEGTYYVLVGCDEVGELYTSVSCEVSKGIDTSFMGDNRVIERTYTDARGDKWNDRIVYYDEMGREQEVVQKGFSPKQRDVASLMEYDDYGRLEREWLPVATSGNGGFKAPLELKNLATQSYGGDTHAYGWTVYEQSQRNEKRKVYGAGGDWHRDDHGKGMETKVNDPSVPSLDCMGYSVSGGIGNITILCTGSLAKGALLVTETTDEDGHVSYEFKDGFGKVILNRRENGNGYADTYYIYDAWGNLLAVLPPMAANEMCVTGKTWREGDDAVAKYAYLYAYDSRYRKNGTKLPSCDWVYTLYDNDDVPVFSQDGEQRLRGEWSFTISDVWGRPCLEGTCRNSLTIGTTLDNVTATPDAMVPHYGYAISGISLVSPCYHKVTFYDNYDFLANPSLGMGGLDCDLSQDQQFGTVVKARAMGRETGGLLAIDGDMDNAIKTTRYYDYRGRCVQDLSTNHLGGLDKTFTAYDFTDHCTSQRQIHQVKGGAALVVDLDNTYDHAGRLLTTTMTVGDHAPGLIASNSYDELGRLASEGRNGNGKLETTYKYNIRSWVESMDGDLFSEHLSYNANPYGGKALYGGNISAMDWTTGDFAGKTRGYALDYDDLGQLKTAKYMEDGRESDKYSTSYSYDLMGNILALTRHGMLDNKGYGLVDDLTYSYNGNQVTRIVDKVSGPFYKDAMHFVDGADAEIEYKYDKNGCMTQDLNKNICSIEYNLLNLPTKISFTDGSAVKYSYSADGEKLSADYELTLMNVINGTSNSTQAGSGVKLHRDYCGDFIYEDGALKTMLFDGGYVTFSGTTPEYHFYLKDHLGSNRVVASANGDIEQVNHYYPFGGLMAESKGNAQSYKYNGKELDRMHGMDSYDYGARWMTNGRFFTPDPHATDYPNVSPYAYCGNNPVSYKDLNGLDSVYYAQDGLELFRYGKDNTETYVFGINTYLTTPQVYYESNKNERGYANPISAKEYVRTQDELLNGNIKGDHMKNVSSFGTLSELRSAFKSIKDNGKGGTIDKNNREYCGDFTKNGVKNVRIGSVGNPVVSGVLPSKGNSDYHSHPSGDRNKHAWQQPPTSQDIKICRPRRSEFVFGMRFNLIYKYNKKGVKAILPFNVLKN